MRNPEFLTIKDGAGEGPGIESNSLVRNALIHATNVSGSTGRVVRVYRLIAVVTPPPAAKPQIELIPGHDVVDTDMPC